MKVHPHTTTIVDNSCFNILIHGQIHWKIKTGEHAEENQIKNIYFRHVDSSNTPLLVIMVILLYYN